MKVIHYIEYLFSAFYHFMFGDVPAVNVQINPEEAVSIRHGVALVRCVRTQEIYRQAFFVDKPRSLNKISPRLLKNMFDQFKKLGLECSVMTVCVGDTSRVYRRCELEGS